MLKRQTWMLLMLLIALVAFTGCSDDDDPVTPPADHFANVAGTVTTILNDGTTPGIITAQMVWDDLNSKAPTYTIVDIRGEEDYNNGHITGAIRSSLGTLVADLGDGSIPTDKIIVFVCYTGQGAGHTKIAAEMLGYECRSMKWGMSSWSPDVTGSKWSEAEKCKDLLSNPESTNNNGDLVDNSYPSLSDGLETRVAAVLANGFKGIAYTSDLDNSENYFLLNYWSELDYLGTGDDGTTGHIPGAFQFTPAVSLSMDTMLSNLPTDKQIIVYCWTGQTSSQVTFALNVMGYDALSMYYGANQLMHSHLTGHKWADTMVADYPLHNTPTN